MIGLDWAWDLEEGHGRLASKVCEFSGQGILILRFDKFFNNFE